MKKLSVVFALLLVLICIAGCQPKPTNTPSIPTNPTTTTAPTTEHVPNNNPTDPTEETFIIILTPPDEALE
jgi:hypothetical protein